MTQQAQAPRRYFDLPVRLADPKRAAAVIVPVPYDATSSWKRGAARGPAAILEASCQVELYDLETGTEPYLRGIGAIDPVRCDGPPEQLAPRVRQSVASILQRGQLPVVLGGEHSVSLGAIRAAAQQHRELSVLQIDAHADTRETYQGSDHSHACVMARVREIVPIVQVGIRSLDASELAALDRSRVWFAHQIHAHAHWDRPVVDLLTPSVWVTIDLDAFDPALMPATGTPEPGGLDWYQVTGLLRELTARRRVVGFDVVELAPQPGQHACEFLAAKLVYRMLAMVFRGARADRVRPR